MKIRRLEIYLIIQLFIDHNGIYRSLYLMAELVSLNLMAHVSEQLIAQVSVGVCTGTTHVAISVLRYTHLGHKI